jgi:hypothetical protein
MSVIRLACAWLRSLLKLLRREPVVDAWTMVSVERNGQIVKVPMSELEKLLKQLEPGQRTPE